MHTTRIINVVGSIFFYEYVFTSSSKIRIKNKSATVGLHFYSLKLVSGIRKDPCCSQFFIFPADSNRLLYIGCHELGTICCLIF